MAAINVAKRVADEMDVEIGSDVGYAVRFNEMHSAATKLLYLTDGMLMRYCMGDQNLPEFDVIILDECHERSVNTDILMGHLKTLKDNRPDLKLVFMSATLDTDK